MTTNDTANNTELQAVRGVGADGSSQGVFLPVAILMLAVILVLSWNLYIAKSQAVIWQKQIAQREQMVNQSRSVQSDLQKIAYDLMSLSLTDPDAKAIIEKYQIKQTGNAAVPVLKP